MLSQEIYSFADNGKAARGRRPSGARSQQSRRASGFGRSGSGIQPTDLLKFVVPIVLVIILIVLIRVLTPKKPATEETSRTSDHNGSSRDHSLGDRTGEHSFRLLLQDNNDLKRPQRTVHRRGPHRKTGPGASVEYLRDHDDTWAVIKYNGQEAYVAKEFLTAE